MTENEEIEEPEDDGEVGAFRPSRITAKLSLSCGFWHLVSASSLPGEPRVRPPSGPRQVSAGTPIR
jgi:hypothetical protein